MESSVKQLTSLQEQRNKLNLFIQNITRTILSAKGEIIMSDKEE